MQTSYQGVIKSDKSTKWPGYPSSSTHKAETSLMLLSCKLKPLLVVNSARRERLEYPCACDHSQRDSNLSSVISPSSNYPLCTRGHFQGDDYDMQACNKWGGCVSGDSNPLGYICSESCQHLCSNQRLDKESLIIQD